MPPHRVPSDINLAEFPSVWQGESIPGTGIMNGWGPTASKPADATVGWAPGALWRDTTTGTIYKNVGTKASANFDELTVTDATNATNAVKAVTSYWSRFPAISSVGSTGVGWAYAAAGIYIEGPTDGVFAYFNIPIQLLPGTIITNIEIKAGGSDTHVKSTVELVKRVDSTIAATAWTSVATATQAAFGSAITVTQATPFTETVLETTSYALRVSAANDAGTPTTQVYSLGIRTSTRIL